MIVRFVTDKKAIKVDEQYFIEVDITEHEMKQILEKGEYPESNVVVYKVDEGGKMVENTDMVVKVSVGHLV